MKKKEIIPALLGLVALLFLPVTNGFPQMMSIITTRNVASRHSAQWDIRHKGSKRLRDISEETVQLNVIVHNEEDVAQLDQLEISGLLTYEEIKEDETNQRLLQGITEDLFCYRTVVETLVSMDQLAEQYPDLVTVKSIGQSYLKQQNENEGYDIKVMILGANASTTEVTNMMVVGGHHSRELPPPETLMRWAEHLTANYGTDADITWILDRTNIHIVPISNPDGRQIVQEHLGWWYRKNARPNNCKRGPKQYGVDLNRNYPMFFGDSLAASDDPCDTDYHGTGPLSEPESSAVYNYASSLFDDSLKKGTPDEAMGKQEEACPTNATGIFIDVHSNGDFVYFPWGYRNEHPPNHLPLLTMSAKLAAPGNYELWGPEQDGYLYFVAGDATDATYGIDCVFSVGYEIGSEMYASCAELKSSIFPIMKESLLYAAKCVSAPYLLPLGPDILSIDVNSTNPEKVALSVWASDEALIVDHAIFPEEQNRSQPISKVLVFVDDHPYNGTSEGIPMEPKDGTFDNVDEMAFLTLDLSALEEGQHVLYFQATDTDGYSGPVSAVFVDLKVEMGIPASWQKPDILAQSPPAPAPDPSTSSSGGTSATLSASRGGAGTDNSEPKASAPGSDAREEENVSSTATSLALFSEKLLVFGAFLGFLLR